jgi:Leucine-rich repeat (LRR) protein
LNYIAFQSIKPDARYLFRNINEIHFIHKEVVALKELVNGLSAFEDCLQTSQNKLPAVKVEIISQIDLEFDELNENVEEETVSDQTWRNNAKPLSELFGCLEKFNMKVLCLCDSFRDFLYYGDLNEGTFNKMSRWKNLAALELENFRIGYVHANAFAHFEHLIELCLIKVDLFRIDSKSFSGLSKLERLELSGNKLSTVPDGTFDFLENLKELELNSNRIVRIQPNLFVKLNKLLELNLSYNPIVEVFCDLTFSGLNNLEELNLIGVPAARKLNKKSAVFTQHLLKIENVFI